MFSLKCSPFCNAKSFCTYKVMFMSFIGYYYTITTSIFFIFWLVTNEPWAKICYQKWAVTELKSVTPFNMTGHRQKIILSPGGNTVGHLTIILMNEGEYRRITPSEISIILHMIRQPNSIITVFLFIQNNS